MYRVIASALLSLLVGCGGRDFIRPQPEAMRVGNTSYEQVLQRFGAPSKTSTTTINGVALSTASYGHAEVGPLGTSFSVRQMLCVFRDNVLVSYDYASSFDGDKTSFDDAKVKSLKKGDAKADVKAALGAPTGEAIYPIVSTMGNSLLRYTFLETTKIPFVPKPKETRRIATITFDPSDKMVEARITESPSD